MPSFYNHYYNYYRPYFSNKKSYQNEETYAKTEKEDEAQDNTKYNYSNFRSFGPISFKNPLFSDIEEPIFEILGIKLFLDDIIIIGLLFFLYKEGVQDELLYIVLIMLLLN